MVQSQQKQFSNLQRPNTELTCDLAIPLLCMYPKTKNKYSNTNTKIFTAVLVTLTNKQNA